MKKFIKNKLLGRKRFQLLFSRLFEISLQGLNIGTGGRHPTENGEAWVLKYALSKIPEKEGLVIFDGGAQIGNYTECVIEALRRVGKSGEIYGFEPSPKEYKKYEEKFSPKGIIALNIALGEAVDRIKFFSPENGTGLGSLHRSDKKSNVYEVESTTIDTIMRQKSIKKIHFLKLDVEGNELSVLKGAKETIQSDKIDFIQFEYSTCSLSAGVSFGDLYDLLHKKYTIYRILRDGFVEIARPGAREEMFFTTNYLAERKRT